MLRDAALMSAFGAENALNSFSVIVTRSMGLSGLVPQDPGEVTLMFTEKVEAFHESCLALLSGFVLMRPLAETTMDALIPYHRRTQANVQRLCVKRGSVREEAQAHEV